MKTTIGRLRIAIAMVVSIFVIGTIGYIVLGLALLGAMYMTITTITTVGYRRLPAPT
ncbi:MAG: ion channel [Ilumatobacteraceae bacterium]